MSRSLLLVSLAAGSLTAPAPATAAASEPEIRSITVRPAEPVVGARGSVRLVIDVIARGARGKDGVTVKVEPGAPPAQAPETPPIASPGQSPAQPPAQSPAQPPAVPGQAPVQHPEQAPGQATARTPARPPVQAQILAPGQNPAQSQALSPPLTAAQASTHVPERTRPHTHAGTRPHAPSQVAAPVAGSGKVSTPSPVAPGRGGPAGYPHTAGHSQSGPKQQPGTRYPQPGQAGPNRTSTNPRPVHEYPNHAHVQPDAAVLDPQPFPAYAAAPKVGIPGQVTPEIPPRLVWRLTPSPYRMTDGWQTWRFLPDKRLNRFYPTGTWTITATAKGRDGATVTQYASFELKRETKLASVRAEKSAQADGVRLRGSLTRVDPRGLTDYGPFAKQRLEILWRPDTTSRWERVGETTTDAAGEFVGTVQGRTGGHWRVHYPGTGHYAPETSKSRQIEQ
ncbi:hypothetical protein GCM10022224_012580 [Nonomuraea antimicrobica]|uniref:Secreted protein n=1 Tax=Nonomuraea antimicrobica TaxID=561173 RepID=A0ABP7B827_9ACTN